MSITKLTTSVSDIEPVPPTPPPPPPKEEKKPRVKVKKTKKKMGGKKKQQPPPEDQDVVSLLNAAEHTEVQVSKRQVYHHSHAQ